MQQGAYAAEAQRQVDQLRRKRRLATVHRRRRLRLALGFASACLVVAAIVIGVTASRTTEKVSEQTPMAGGTQSSLAPVTAAAEDRPAFARLGDRNLLLPVAASDATIIAYQPVSDERAVPLAPIGDQANANALVRFFRSIFSSEPSVRYYLIDGADGEATTSVLVGAQPGSLAYAPISGVVTGVKEYLLYGKYTDVQIDIRPEKSSGITVSLMFVCDPVVSIGEAVTAGKTPLGKVRECPEELSQTLAVYTHDSGSHLHLQVSEEPVN
jgi:hypothetical protein